MKVFFKNKWSRGYHEKEITVVLNFGTLEPLCRDLGIEFHQLDEYTKKNNFDFMCLLLYWGYITACRERYQKPKYTKTQAIVWYSLISKEAEAELKQLLIDLSGSIQKMAKPTSKKKVN
jgi:hypothetical protein